MTYDPSLVTHYAPNGSNDVTQWDMWGGLPFSIRNTHVVFEEDFFKYTAGDWVITETGTGTRALANESKGVLVVTNGASDDNANFFQWAGGAGAVKEQWKFVAGKELYFEAIFKVSDVTQSDFVFGLQITDTTPLAVTDGVYFKKDDGSSSIDCVVRKDNTQTTTSVASLLANDTYIKLGFHYNGSNEVRFFANGSKIATLATTNLPDDEELAISFGIQNGEAVAKVLSVDRIKVVLER